MKSLSVLDEKTVISLKLKAVEDKHIPNDTIVSYSVVEGHLNIISRYYSDIWELQYICTFPRSTPKSSTQINFQRCPASFRSIMKECFFYYLFKYGQGKRLPSGGTAITFYKRSIIFLNYLETLSIDKLSDVTEMHCIQFVEQEKNRPTKSGKNKGKRQSPGTLAGRLTAVDLLHQLSKLTSDKLIDPWPDSSPYHLSGRTNKDRNKSTTEIIPDEILATMFAKSIDYIEQADRLLALRDGINEFRESPTWKTNPQSMHKIYFGKNNWKGGLKKLNAELDALLDACIVIILTTTGIRLHELVYINSGVYQENTNPRGNRYITLDDDDEPYYWLRTVSTKTYEGECEFMMSEITYKVLGVAERVTAPLRNRIKKELSALKKSNPHHPDINIKSEYINAVLLCRASGKFYDITPLTDIVIRYRLKRFVNLLGIDWNITSHQFRRTFAVYCARSQHGDLRYLKEHFHHWSLEMTALYALNNKQEEGLYNEIMLTIKEDQLAIASSWFEDDTIITGGATADGIRTFRSKFEAATTYKDRGKMIEGVINTIHLRATGIAWCTADDLAVDGDVDKCVGGTIKDPTRCGNCPEAVIDLSHQRKWQAIYEQQIELTYIDDIGEVGQERVRRDLERCEKVLTGLGVDLGPIKRKIQGELNG